MMRYVFGVAAVSLAVAGMAVPAAAARENTLDCQKSTAAQDHRQPSPQQQSQRPKFWWRDEADKAELGLTPQQAAQIEQIWQSRMPQATEQWKLRETLEAELDRMIKESRVSEKEIAAQIDKVEAVRASLNKSRTLMLYKMHQVLTPAQRVKLDAIRERRQRENKNESKKQPEKQPNPES